MTMLIKHGSAVAREARFPVPAPPVVPPAMVPPVAAPSSEEERTIARLMQEVAALRGERDAMRARWGEELATAERRAREGAARDHVADDARRDALLKDALEAACAAFATGWSAQVDRCAREMAALAMGKLFAVRAEDERFLADVVARRLSGIDREAVVELRVSPEDAAGAALDGLTPGTRIVADGAMRAGTALVQLRLGGVAIDPAAGYARLRALLIGEAADA
ncbi:hypothetical protein [Sphingomonas adhaesiva]|uniref:hypothetical protein n=1 Tax=Sphingomonas adhaesiva TaxID=28212 RepID=UPI002FF7DAE1